MDLSKDRLSNKSKKHSQIQLVTSWKNTQEHSPAFKRLMLLLLKDRSKKSGVEKQDELAE